MISALTYSVASVVAVSLMSMIGLFTFFIKENKLKKVLLYLVAFSVGALLGDVFIHLIPEAAEAGFSLTLSMYVISGIVVSFIVEKFIHWRHCHVMYGSIEHCKDNSHHTDHHSHEPLAWMNLFADGIHNLIDGLLIGASYLVSIPVGLATTLAVVFHEIPQELGDFGILLHAGFSKGKAVFYNFLFALTSVIGAVVAIYLGSAVDGLTEFLVPFAAGSFIYIACCDLIPELQKEVKVEKSLIQLAAFILGIVLMAALLLFD